MDLASMIDEAQKVTQAVIDQMSGQANEDDSDAIYCIGTIWQGISAEMLYEVYKDDPDETAADALTKKTMRAMIEKAREDVEEAWSTLVPFGITKEHLAATGTGN